MNRIFASFAIALALFVPGQILAQDCSFQTKKEDIQIEWTAFKEPTKVGVAGTFKELGLEKELLSSNSIAGIFEGVKFAIPTSTVFTKDSGRDAKIAQFFFRNVKEIKGSVLESGESSMVVGIEMNGVKKEVPLTVVATESSLEATGYIDVLDFSMNKHLAALNKACYELHKGKTWSDVGLKLTAKISKVCK